jgi:hypothetical protein
MEFFNYSDGNQFVFYYDNATLHKSLYIRELLVEIGASAITNCPYSPETNFIERIIKVHKQKIKKQMSLLRYGRFMFIIYRPLSKPLVKKYLFAITQEEIR